MTVRVHCSKELQIGSMIWSLKQGMKILVQIRDWTRQIEIISMDEQTKFVPPCLCIGRLGSSDMPLKKALEVIGREVLLYAEDHAELSIHYQTKKITIKMDWTDSAGNMDGIFERPSVSNTRYDPESWMIFYKEKKLGYHIVSNDHYILIPNFSETMEIVRGYRIVKNGQIWKHIDIKVENVRQNNVFQVEAWFEKEKLFGMEITKKKDLFGVDHFEYFRAEFEFFAKNWLMGLVAPEGLSYVDDCPAVWIMDYKGTIIQNSVNQNYSFMIDRLIFDPSPYKKISLVLFEKKINPREVVFYCKHNGKTIIQTRFEEIKIPREFTPIKYLQLWEKHIEDMRFEHTGYINHIGQFT